MISSIYSKRGLGLGKNIHRLYYTSCALMGGSQPERMEGSIER